MEIYNISNYENLRKKSEKSSNINQAILKFENGNLNNKLNNYYENCIKTWALYSGEDIWRFVD